MCLWHSGSLSWGEGLGGSEREVLHRQLGCIDMSSMGSMVYAVALSMWLCILLLENQSEKQWFLMRSQFPSVVLK